MFLLRGISHILSYIGSKIENFFNNLFGDCSFDTLFITATTLFWFVDLLTISGSGGIYGLNSPKAQQIMLFNAGIEFLICVILSVLTVIMENVNYHVAYYTRAIALSFLLAAFVLVVFTVIGFLLMLIS